MSYSLVKIATVYPEYSVRFRRAVEPGQSYAEMFDHFARDHYNLSDYYARHLRARGRDATELVANLEPLQKAWARENGIKHSDETSGVDIILAQVSRLSPDVLYLQDLFYADESVRAALRNACRRPPLMIGWRAATTPNFDAYADIDVILSSEPNFVRAFREAGSDAELLPHGFEPTITDDVPLPAVRTIAFSFAGTVGDPTGAHGSRFALVKRLLDATPLEVWSSTPKQRTLTRRVGAGLAYKTQRALARAGLSRAVRQAVPVIGRAATWTGPPSVPAPSHHTERWHPPVYGRDYYRVLASSHLTLNVHIDAPGGLASNMRIFEATGMGACVVTDAKPNLPDLFEPDDEIATYGSAEECIEKVGWLLANPAAAREIGDRGRRRTLRDHTIAERVARLDEIILRRLRS